MVEKSSLLLLIAAGTLAGCGGGGGGSGIGSLAGTSAGTGSVPASSVDASAAVVADGSPMLSALSSSSNQAPSGTTIATEGGTFTVPAGTVVSYGANSSWITQTVSGTGSCSNAFFGSDP